MLKSFFLNRTWRLWSWGGLIVIIVSLFFQVQMTVAINSWYGKFYDLLQNAADYVDKPQEGAAQGKMVLKSYIEYAKTGKLEIGDTSEGKEPMSEFEVFVKNGLEKMGYEVVPQVGVSGFYIDLGIKHKSYPDGFIAGIECDGRAYHSSRSQRDADILRQSVLEDLDWKIYRIWSTDWWLNPQKELRKLDRYINKII